MAFPVTAAPWGPVLDGDSKPESAGGVGGGRSTEHLVSSGEGTVRGWTRLPAFLSEVSGEDQGTSQGQQRAEMEMNGFWGTSVPS